MLNFTHEWAEWSQSYKTEFIASSWSKRALTLDVVIIFTLCMKFGGRKLKIQHSFAFEIPLCHYFMNLFLTFLLLYSTWIKPCAHVKCHILVDIYMLSAQISQVFNIKQIVKYWNLNTNDWKQTMWNSYLIWMVSSCQYNECHRAEYYFFFFFFFFLFSCQPFIMMYKQYYNNW